MKAGALDGLIRVERPVADSDFDGAGSGEWVVVVPKLWAQITDMLPSRGERIANGFNMAARPSRVRIYFRTDITPDMRFVDISSGVDGRVMQIVSGPATIGRREAMDFMVEDYLPAGSAA